MNTVNQSKPQDPSKLVDKLLRASARAEQNEADVIAARIKHLNDIAATLLKCDRELERLSEEAISAKCPAPEYGRFVITALDAMGFNFNRQSMTRSYELTHELLCRMFKASQERDDAVKVWHDRLDSIN